MWGTATAIFAIAAVASPVLIELLRSIAHRYRADSSRGTQDVAMWGTAIGWLCILGTVICGSAWALSG